MGLTQIDTAEQRAQLLRGDLASPLAGLLERHRISALLQPLVAQSEMQVMRPQPRVLFG